jgi:hypothetical protein
MSARAAARPKPSALPVMNTRGIHQPRGMTRTVAARARPPIIGFKYELPAYFVR